MDWSVLNWHEVEAWSGLPWGEAEPCDEVIWFDLA